MGIAFGKIHKKNCCCNDDCATCCSNTFPRASLFATFTLLNITPRCECLDGLVIELAYMGIIINDLDECEVKWEGTGARPCPEGLNFTLTFICRHDLNSGDGSSDFEILIDGNDWIQGTFDFYSADCDPFSYCIRSNAGFPFETDQECGDGTVDDDAPQIEICLTE